MSELIEVRCLCRACPSNSFWRLKYLVRPTAARVPSSVGDKSSGFPKCLMLNNVSFGIFYRPLDVAQPLQYDEYSCKQAIDVEIYRTGF